MATVDQNLSESDICNLWGKCVAGPVLTTDEQSDCGYNTDSRENGTRTSAEYDTHANSYRTIYDTHADKLMTADTHADNTMMIIDNTHADNSQIVDQPAPSLKRPRGRPPKGKIWDEFCGYIDDIPSVEVDMTQFNRLRVYQDRAGLLQWQGAYRDGNTKLVTAAWVKENFKPFFICRVMLNLGRWCFVPVGKMDSTVSPQSVAANLKGMFGFGTQDPELTPEVRYQSAEGGGDFCLSYSVASAAHHRGDAKLSSVFEKQASAIEEHERQMQIVRKVADDEGWEPHKIVSVEAIAAFDPLTACPDGDILIMHLKQTDGASDHAVTITLGWIFDANRTHALPLSTDGLRAINYAGIVSATLLTPKPKIAAALAKKRKAGAIANGVKMPRVV